MRSNRLGLGWLDQPRLDPGFRASRLSILSACLGGLEIACCKVDPLLSRLRALLSWSAIKARALLWLFMVFVKPYAGFAWQLKAIYIDPKGGEKIVWQMGNAMILVDLAR